MDSFLFKGLTADPESMIVEGEHKPGTLTVSSGAWIQYAGRAMFTEAGQIELNRMTQWVWIAVAQGRVKLRWSDAMTLDMEAGQSTILPADQEGAVLQVSDAVSVVWMALDGPLASLVVRKMGALLHAPLLQTALPSQMYLAEQIAQVMVRHSGTSHATYQLQHLMYGMLASQWGQPVAMDAMLSHEIGKVVDMLRADRYKDNFSLAEMAAISRMPMETFRKRFVSEVGMPPLSYMLHCKMERAKELLRDQNCTVREAGVEIGMSDPYHFSKQFKNIVGISPSAFMKLAADPAKPHKTRKRKTKKEDAAKPDPNEGEGSIT